MGAIPEKDPAFLLKENVRILLTTLHALQRKVVGFSWRKLFPFNLYFRAVDFPAYARFLEEIRGKIDEQRKVCLEHPVRGESAPHREFFDAMEDYLRPLGDSADELREVALLMRENAPLKEINARLDRYQECCARYHDKALELAQAWTALVQSFKDEENGEKSANG